MAAADTINADLDGQIAALDPASPTYGDDVAALEEQKIDTTTLNTELQVAQDYGTELDRLAAESNAQMAEYDAAVQLEQDALDAATGGHTLSDAAMIELRDRLGL